MAACLKCGKSKLRRNKRGERKCQRCGVMPSAKHLDQGGNYPPEKCRGVANGGTQPTKTSPRPCMPITPTELTAHDLA